MNFITRVVVVALLASNIGLAGLWWRECSRTTAETKGSTATISANVAVSGRAGEAKESEKIAPAGRDPRALRDVLRAAGVDEELIRKFVHSAVWHKNQRDDAEKRRREWWKHSPHSSRFEVVPAATRNAIDAEIKELLGPERMDAGDFAKRFAGVTTEKRAALERIFTDYADMTSAAYTEMGRFQMPEDQKRLELLKAERERDLKELLTAAEYEQVMFRELPEVQRAQMVAEQLDLTEPEFREVLRMRRELAERLGANATPQASNEAEKRFDAELAAMIGRERMEEQQTKQSRDYTVLDNARARLGFSDEVFAGVMARRSQALAQAAEIQAGAMPLPEKKKALKALVAEVKASVTQQIGTAAAEGYFMQGGMSWLRDMDRGYGVRVGNGGWVETMEIK